MEGAPEPDATPILSDGPLVILSTIWTADGCLLRVRRPGEDSELIAARGLELNYRADPDRPRHCVGHHSPKRNDGAYVECHNRPQPGEKTCVSCAVADAEFASDLHHAHTRSRDQLHDSVVQHLQRSNILYLAAFRDGSIKVGTSTGTRRATRLVEQGAWQAVEAATVADGFAVRRLEDLVTERLGLPQAVAATRKLKGMISPHPDEVLRRSITERLAEVHELLSSPEGLDAGASVATAQWWAFPGHDEPVWQGLHRYPTRPEVGHHHVRIEAMCGRLAVLARPGGNDHFVADLGALYGRELELGHFTPDELLVQDSLF